MLTEPFYGFFLLNLNKKFSKDLPTAGVYREGINLALAINEEFWENLNEDQKVAILKHELLHICFFHLDEMSTYGNKQLFNIAADIEINQYITRSHLPKGHMYLDTFPTIHLEPKKGTKYYYEKLQENLNKPRNPNQSQQSQSGQGGGQGQSDSQQNDQQNQSGQSDQSDQSDKSKGSGSGQYRDEVLDKMMNQEDMHASWDWYQNLSSAEKRLVQNQIEHQLKETAKNTKRSRGAVPGELKSRIDELFEIKEAVFNWKAYFRRMLGNSLEIYTRKTRRKPSKRFDGNPAIKIKKKQRVLVGVDTSASVPDSEILEFFSEIHHIYKAGVGITVVECDTKIGDIYEYSGKFRGTVTGRGGTTFDPVIDYFNDRSDEYTLCVYFTDGGAPAPVNKCKKELIWIISSNGSVYDNSLKGKIIKIPKT